MMRDTYWKAVILMVMVQISYGGINVLYKLAVKHGMSLKVIIAYRFIFATAFTAPLAFFFERKKMPKMTWTIVFQTILCGLFGGTLSQTLYLEMLALTSVTFASAMGNLNPLVTFIMSLCFRLNWREGAGKAKTLGTLTGIGGAMLLTLFKGPQLHTPSFHLDAHVAPSHSSSSTAPAGRTLLGAIFAMSASLSYALWLIVQAKMSEKFPCHYTSTAMMNLTASLFSVAFAFCFERDSTQWRLGANIRLLTVAYAGLVPAGVAVVVIAWCVHVRGPLFVSAFSPLTLLILAFVASFFLDETLCLGSIIGGVLIVCGLYAVLWGKSKEVNKKKNVLVSSRTHSHDTHSIQILVKSDPLNHNQQHHSSENNASEAVHDDSHNKSKKQEVTSTNV